MNNRLVLMTDDDIAKGSSGEVRNNKDLDLRHRRGQNTNKITRSMYEAGGLYDPDIFGMPESCICGKTNIPGIICPYCRVKVYDTGSYLKNYGYYKLNVPYISSIKVASFIKKLSSYITLSDSMNKFDIRDLWSCYISYQLIKNPDIEALKADTSNTYVRSKEGDVYKLTIDLDLPDIKGIESEAKTYLLLENCGLFGFRNLADHTLINGQSLAWIKSFINFNLVIPSPGLRPFNKIPDGNGSFIISIDPITVNYRVVIEYNNELIGMITKQYTELVDKVTLCYIMNILIDKIMDANELLQPSKESMGRNLVETRVKKNFRSNIVSALDLQMNQCYVPKEFSYLALQADILYELNKTNSKESDSIREYSNRSPKAMKIFENIVNKSMVVLCRNPSLHRFNIQAFHPIIWNEVSIGIPIAICKAYNGDFDGDTMYCQFYTDDKHIAELQSITPDKLWFYDKLYKPQSLPEMEVAYGIYLASKITVPRKGIKGFTKYEEIEDAYNNGKISLNEKILFNDKETTYGRAKLSKILEIDIEQVSPNEPIDSKKLAKIIAMLGYKDKRLYDYKELQDFAEYVATTTGFGPLRFEQLYHGDPKTVKSILDMNIPKEDKSAKLKSYFKECIADEIDKLPESNFEDLKITGKVNPDTIIDIYAPAISTDDTVNCDSSSLLNGLSERSFNNMALQNRDTLFFKQVMTASSGYTQRQLVNAELDLVYKDEIGSPDKVGIILDGKDAVGRTDLGGNIITKAVEGKVRVKSCINNDTNIVYKDEISARDFVSKDSKVFGKKFTFNDGAAIGIAFAEALTESAMQYGLKFKHGGALKYEMSYYTVSMERGTVTDIDGDYLTIKGDHEYKYIITERTQLFDDIKIGTIVDKGQKIMKLSDILGADDGLSRFHTMIGAQIAGTGEGRVGSKLPIGCSYSIEAGTIGIGKRRSITIGNYSFKINQGSLYKYPIGYTVNELTQISNGIPDMNWYINTADVASTYYIFYDYLKSLGSFDGFNSEPFETLFKCIYKTGFNIKQTIYAKDSFTDRIYYGGAVKNFENEISKTRIDKNDRVSVKLNNGIILPFILGLKDQ